MKALGLSSRPCLQLQGRPPGRATWVRQAWQPEPLLRGLNVKQLVTFLIAPSGLVQGEPGALTSPEMDHEEEESAGMPGASALEPGLRDLAWGKKERER